MLTTELLFHRFQGEEIQSKRLRIDKASRALVEEIIGIFQGCVGLRRAELDEQLSVLEGEETDYRVKRGLAHLLASGFCTFETVSPLEPEALRARVFVEAARRIPSKENRQITLQAVADALTEELGRAVAVEEIETGLYADLADNQIIVSFETPAADALLHRYNVAQVQGVFIPRLGTHHHRPPQRPQRVQAPVSLPQALPPDDHYRG